MRILSRAIVLLGLSIPLAAAHAGDDSKLAELFQADQAERAGFAAAATSKARMVEYAKQLAVHDAARRAEAEDALHRGRLHTANDYYMAAMLMQHGQRTRDYELAHALATVVAALAPDDDKSRWLAAASMDRLLVSRHQPLWYGTQPVCEVGKSSDAQVAFRLDVAEGAVDDGERAAAGIAPLEELKRQAAARGGELGAQVQGGH